MYFQYYNLYLRLSTEDDDSNYPVHRPFVRLRARRCRLLFGILDPRLHRFQILELEQGALQSSTGFRAESRSREPAIAAGALLAAKIVQLNIAF